MSVYIKDMNMPIDCLECKIGCIYATSLIVGRPPDCPLTETSDLISRADAIEAICNKCGGCDDNHDECWEITALKALPSAETTGALDDAIAKYVADGLMELPSAEAVQGEWVEKGGELVCSVCGNSVSFSRTPKGWVLGRFCQTCGAKMTKGGDDE